MFIKTNAGTLPFSSLPLNNSGTVKVGLGTSLTFASGTHTFDAGSSFSGTGTIRFQSPVVLATDLNSGTLDVVFQNSATVSGNFPIANAPGCVITVNKTMAFPGSMTGATSHHHHQLTQRLSQ
jgi:hypothetical protein